MSLVNDALKKARLEAARDAAANRNVPYPALGRGEREPNRTWVAAFAGLVVLAAVGGFFLFRAGKQSALRTEAAVPAPSAADSAAGALEPAAATQPQTGIGEMRAPGAVQTGVADLEQRRAAGTGSSGGSSAGSAARPERPETTPTPPARLAEESRPTPRAEPLAPATTDRAEAAPTRHRQTGAQPAAPAPTNPPRPAAPTPEQTARRNPELARESAASSEPPAIASPEPERDSSGRAKAPVEAVRSADIPGVGSIELGGIAWSGDRPFALVNGRVVRPGDSVAGLVVAEIQSNTVRLSGAGGDWVLRLK